MTEQGGSRAEGSIMPPPCAKCGEDKSHFLHRPCAAAARGIEKYHGVDEPPHHAYEPVMEGSNHSERQRESSRSDLLDGDDSGHGGARDRSVEERALELAVLAERMRGALANIRVYLTEMEQENDELRRAAAKWSEL